MTTTVKYTLISLAIILVILLFLNFNRPDTATLETDTDKLLKNGDSGSDVGRLQEKLNEIILRSPYTIYYTPNPEATPIPINQIIPVTGYFGPLTEQALMGISGSRTILVKDISKLSLSTARALTKRLINTARYGYF